MVCVCVLSHFSCVRLCDPMDCSPQAPLSMEFSRQEYWSGLPCPPPGDFSQPRNQTLRFLHWQVGSLPLAPPEKCRWSVLLKNAKVMKDKD